MSSARRGRTLVVESPGMFSSVQDLGRPGWSHLAVAAGGAADPRSLTLGNRLLGNPDSAAAIEATLVGPSLRFEASAAICVAGAESLIEVHGRRGPSRRPTGAPFLVEAGETIAIGRLSGGARCYICAHGGIDVPRVLGSRSTHLAAGFGGHAGRVLRAGDRLALADSPRSEKGDWLDAVAEQAVSPLAVLTLPRDRPVQLRAIPNPLLSTASAAILGSLWDRVLSVSARSSRAGVRLVGLAEKPASIESMPSEPMPPGAIQWPGGSEFIILGVDRPTTGGYPLLACVIEADRWIVGQLSPGMKVRIRPVSLKRSIELLQASLTRLNVRVPPIEPPS